MYKPQKISRAKLSLSTLFRGSRWAVESLTHRISPVDSRRNTILLCFPTENQMSDVFSTSTTRNISPEFVTYCSPIAKLSLKIINKFLLSLPIRKNL